MSEACSLKLLGDLTRGGIQNVRTAAELCHQYHYFLTIFILKKVKVVLFHRRKYLRI